MAKEDQEKMVFITNQGLYCHKVMSFGLKNADATYQRLVNKVFTNQIERNMKAYVDNMLVKSKSMSQHIADLEDEGENGLFLCTGSLSGKHVKHLILI